MDAVKLDAVAKQIKKLPQYVKDKLLAWVKSVEEQGIRETRKIKGYHDEPLKGKRVGQRSVRLTKHYRAIYREERGGTVNLIIVEEVNKHEY
ncbi:MAG: hypothetical protein OXB88_08920 [Bacteriovoracales bacterium]|nr:hypothetical protein [Bacteriovoracales bacterium]